MNFVGPFVGVLFMLVLMKPMGIIPAMIIGGIVGGLIGVLRARSEISEIESNSSHQGASRNPLKQGVFVFDQEKLTPRKYGEAAVVMSTQSAAELLKTIFRRVGDRANGDKIYSRMILRPRIAQLQIMALHVAIYYVYAQAALEVPKDVISEVISGIVEDIDRSLGDVAAAKTMKTAIHAYSQSLVSEFQSSPEEIGFDVSYGPTAQLAVAQITTDYSDFEEFRDRKALEVMEIDSVFLRANIHTSIVSLLKALKEANLSFMR